jgi:hypothetical protein
MGFLNSQRKTKDLASEDALPSRPGSAGRCPEVSVYMLLWSKVPGNLETHNLSCWKELGRDSSPPDEATKRERVRLGRPQTGGLDCSCKEDLSFSHYPGESASAGHLLPRSLGIPFAKAKLR